MKIQHIKTKDIKPYSQNNRIHSKTQIERIANSIKQFEFDQPIIVDSNNVVIAGHGRLEAAKHLKLDSVPCVVSDLGEVAARARRILDNKLQNDSEWDFENVALELAFLEDSDFPLTDWGLEDLLPNSKDAAPPEMPSEDVMIMITCDNEAQQQELYAEFENRGLKCKLIG